MEIKPNFDAIRAMKDTIKRQVEDQRKFKEQRKTKNLRATRVMMPSEAQAQHAKNRNYLHTLYLAYAMLRLKDFKQLERKNPSLIVRKNANTLVDFYLKAHVQEEEAA